MKTSEANIEDLKGMVVSDGTMRSEDLIPKFLNVLKVYGRDVYDKYVGENPEVLDLSGMDDETMGWVVDELFDKLNEIAPEGYSFESQDGDGACYGFWSVDADERKKCEAYIQPVTLYSTTRYDDAEAVQSFLRDIGSDAVTVDKQRNGDVLSVNVSGSDDDVEAFVDTYKNEYGSIVKDCEVDATGWTAPEDIYYIATEQGRKELRGESKKSEADGGKDIFTLDLTRIYADGNEEGLDDMQAAQNFYDEDEAIQAAKDLADSYKDDDDVVQVTVMAGEHEKLNGDIVGDSFDIFTASSSDSVTTAKYREKANYTKTDGLDYYAKGGKSESKKSEDFDMNKAFFQAKKAITDWTKRQGHKTLEWLYTDGRKSPTSYPSGIWDFEWDTGNGMATAELKVSPYETRTNSWNDRMDFSLRVGTEDKPVFYTSVEDVLYALDTLISKTEIKMESKKFETKEDKPVWGVTVEYTPVNGETRRTDVAPSCYTEERAKEAAIARVTKDYGPLKDVKVIRVDRLPEWAARNIRDLVRNNKTESMSNRIENTTITEQEFSDILNAYVKAVEGNDIKPIRIEVLKTEPVEGDGTLIKLHYDARENGWSNARTYALVFGDLHKNRDNDLIYVLHDWQSGEKVTPEDIADHDWELVNNYIRPSEILDATKSSESLDPSLDVKGRGVVELSEDDYLKLSRDINSRGYCKDKDGGYNVWIGGSFKGKFPSVEAAADAGYTLVEGKRCEAQVSEKTFKQGVDEFIGAAPEGGWSDYWAMQQDWEFYKDSLCRDGVITQKQADSWSNPCTPDTFDRWQKRNGLVRRGYESKKSEGVTGIDGTMYASKLKSLARKLGSFGFKVSDNIEVKDENANDKSAEYNLSAEKDGKSYKINVDIYEGKHTTITLRDGATNAFISHLGEGSSFASAVSAIDADSVKSEESKKSEADATFKVGDFVSYEAGADGKDTYDAYVYCEVIGINDDGTLDLCPFGTDADTDGIGDNANPAYCEKLDHFAGMVDANHYYMDGKYNAYKGGWEILITDKELNPKVYEFIGTIDDLSEVVDIDDYYGGENFVFDEDLKDEVANDTGWDVETTTFADMTGDVGDSKPAESKKSEARPTKQEAQIKELCKLCRNDKNVAEAVFKALTKDYNTSLDPVLAGQYLTAKWKSKLEELGGCNGWYDGFKKLYAAMGSDFVCSVLQDLKLGSSEIGCGACITIISDIYDKVVKRKDSKKSESLTLKQKELKDMARYGEAEDITTISDVEAKELKKKGIETVGISRGAYGMNGALLRDSEGKKYVITARSSNLFYFV